MWNELVARETEVHGENLSKCRRITSSRMLRRVALVRTYVSEERKANFLRKVGSYKSHTASHPRRQHSS
jgi:hypothetical protein